MVDIYNVSVSRNFKRFGIYNVSVIRNFVLKVASKFCLMEFFFCLTEFFISETDKRVSAMLKGYESSHWIYSPVRLADFLGKSGVLLATFVYFLTTYI